MKRPAARKYQQTVRVPATRARDLAGIVRHGDDPLHDLKPLMDPRVRDQHLHQGGDRREVDFVASPIVRVNAPGTAPPIVEKMLPTAPPRGLTMGPMIGMLAVTSGTWPPAAYAGAGDSSSPTSRSSQAPCPPRPADQVHAGHVALREDDRNDDQDRRRAGDQPGPVIRSALGAQHRRPGNDDENQTHAAGDQPLPVALQRADQALDHLAARATGR